MSADTSNMLFMVGVVVVLALCNLWAGWKP